MLRKFHFFIVLFLCFTFLASGVSIDTYAQTAQFKGIVKDKSNGQALKDVHLFILNSTYQTFSDSLGRFSIPNIPLGRWEVYVIAEGFEVEKKSLELVKNKSEDFEFLMNPESELTVSPSLSEKKQIKLVDEFLDSFLKGSNFPEDIRLLNPDALRFSEVENSKEIQVDSESYLIFVNDKTGFLFTLYLLRPYLIGSTLSKDQVLLAYLDLINEDPDHIAEKTSEREKIFSKSPEYVLRQLLTGEISTSDLPEELKVSFGEFPGEYLLSFSKPLKIEGKGNLSYEGEELALRSGGSVVFEDQLILEGDFSKIHPLDQLPRNFNVEKVLQLANIEKNAQVLQEKVFLQTDRAHYLKGESIFFKVNMIYANPLLAPELSKVLHIELLDTTGFQELHFVYPIQSGKAMGSLKLPIDLNQQNYILHAYTSWSLNYEDKKGSFLPIQIHDPSLKPSIPLPTQGSKNVSIFSDKQNYGPDEPVSLNIMVRDANGKPIAADLAIRVLDLEKASPETPKTSMIEDFELSPVSSEVDFKKFEFPLENRFAVIGQLKNQDQKAMEGKGTALINGLENMVKFDAGKDGLLKIPDLAFEGDFEIAAKAETKDGLPIRNFDLQIQDFHSGITTPTFEYPQLSSTSAQPLSAKEIQESMQQGEILMDEFVIDEEKEDPVGSMVYGHPDASVNPEELPLNGSTSQFLYLLAGKVAGMSVTGNPPSIRFRNGGEPLVMIDGVPINPPTGSMLGGGSPSGRTATDIIAGINVFAIKRVEVIKRTVSMLGEGGRNGIISIFMKTGKELEEANEALSNNFTSFQLTGFPIKKSFSTILEEQQQNPLLRGLKPTLYWNPELITNSEELSQKVQFKSSATGSPMWVEIKGISADGQPIEGRFVLNQH